MDSTNDEFPMLSTKFDSLVNQNKYTLNTSDLRENQVYYVIDMENRDYIIKTICQKPEGQECELKELETGRIINNFGGTKWVDVYQWPWSGGKIKSRTQKRKRTKTQKTTRIRKRRTTKKTLNKKI